MLKYFNVVPYAFTGYIIGGLTDSFFNYMITPSKKMYEYIQTDMNSEKKYSKRFKHFDDSDYENNSSDENDEDDNYNKIFDEDYRSYLNFGSILGFFFGIYYYNKIE